MKTLIMLLAAVTISACGDDEPEKKAPEVEPELTEADGLNERHYGQCHACGDNQSCYCWWEMVNDKPVCVEVDRFSKSVECINSMQ